MRIKIIDRYILREFLNFLIGMFFVVIIVLLIYVFIESYEDLMEHKPKFWHIIFYFAFSLPYLMLQTIPLMIAISAAYSIGALAKKKEILVMITSGISPARIIIPLLISGVILSIFTFYFGEIAVPYSQEKANYIEKVYIEGKGENIVTKNKDIFVKGKGSRFYIMKDFDSKTNTMSSPIIFDVNDKGSGLKQRIEAQKAELVVMGEKNNAWKFTGYIRHVYDDSGNLLNIEQSDKSILIPMEEDLEKFLSNRKRAEEMNYSELKNYLAILNKRGDSNPDLETDLNLKMSFPVGCFIVILLGFYFAIKAQSHNLILSVGEGIGMTALYYAVVVMFQGLGHHGFMSPIVAAWLPIVLFGLLGGALLLKEV